MYYVVFNYSFSQFYSSRCQKIAAADCEAPSSSQNGREAWQRTADVALQEATVTAETRCLHPLSACFSSMVCAFLLLHPL